MYFLTSFRKYVVISMLAGATGLMAFSSVYAREAVVIFHAGSLTIPLEAMEQDFEALHPDIDIQRTAGGSTRMARMISEEGKSADIMASADYTVIDKNLIPDFAEWNIRFASNQLVLCYTDKSRFAESVNGDNWFDILAKKEVVWGHSDPNLDPCGYRSLMVLQLAEKYYRKPGLYERLIENRPEKNVQPKAAELVALLKTGHMDYAWEYLSVAVQHNLNYLILPDKINLGSYSEDAFYRQASVRVTGKKPGEWITRNGKSITYGVAMLKSASNPNGAVLFLEYLLSPDKGLKVLKEMGQPPFEPARVPDASMKARLPAPLRPLVDVKN